MRAARSAPCPTSPASLGPLFPLFPAWQPPWPSSNVPGFFPAQGLCSLCLETYFSSQASVHPSHPLSFLISACPDPLTRSPPQVTSLTTLCYFLGPSTISVSICVVMCLPPPPESQRDTCFMPHCITKSN